MDKLESAFQKRLIKDLTTRFPGCWIMKNDEQYRQGTPDLTILYGLDWAVLECKREMPTKASDYQPNQEHYIKVLNNMAFCRMICPENFFEVIEDLEYHFGVQKR